MSTNTSLDYIEEGAVALCETKLRTALHLRRACRDVKHLTEVARRVEHYLVDLVGDDAVGAAELLLELRDALYPVRGDA